MSDILSLLDIRRGRCNRLQAVALIALAVLIGFVDERLTGGSSVASFVFYYIYFIALARRFHDINYSAFIPVSVLVSLIISAILLTMHPVCGGDAIRAEQQAQGIAFNVVIAPWCGWVGVIMLGGLSIFGIVTFLLVLAPGSPGTNRFGPAPVGLLLMSMVKACPDHEAYYSKWRRKEVGERLNPGADIEGIIPEWRSKEESERLRAAMPANAENVEEVALSRQRSVKTMLASMLFRKRTVKECIDILFFILFTIFCFVLISALISGFLHPI